MRRDWLVDKLMRFRGIHEYKAENKEIFLPYLACISSISAVESVPFLLLFCWEESKIFLLCFILYVIYIYRHYGRWPSLYDAGLAVSLIKCDSHSTKPTYYLLNLKKMRSEQLPTLWFIICFSSNTVHTNTNTPTVSINDE